MNCTNKQQETAECEKRGCEGCFYNQEVDDLTTVYMSGFYDGEKKWKDRIKEKLNTVKDYKAEIDDDIYDYKKVQFETYKELLERTNIIEDKIKVGDYVRTKKGYISKIEQIDNYIWFDSQINKKSGLPVYELSKEEFKNLVVKHSQNLIDLIEANDYVNESRVFSISDGIVRTFNLDYVEDDIKSIVTKEQFKSIEYTIHEREEKENIKDKE